MKDRIIRYLGEFAEGKKADLSDEVKTSLHWGDRQLQEMSREMLTRILHQYSQFSISTIDAFFQRVIRSFTRESGLLGNFRLEVENELILGEVIEELMDELGDANPQLTRWVIQFSAERLTEGESWNITEALKGFGKEIFKDSYLPIGEEIQRVKDRISYTEFLASLKKIKEDFLSFMQVRGAKAMQLMKANGITADDFNYKDVGTAFKYFREYSNRNYMEVKDRVLASSSDANDWASRKSARNKELKQLAERELMPLLKEMIEYDQEHLLEYNSADFVEQNFYSYGLLADISRKLKDYQSENNMMLLSDASHFLNGVINNSDTPFIYEKVGSFYRHYLIDEFQDTSDLQWKNFRPLLVDALDQNNRSLVVGDVKQSVYRWRGGDLGLLQESVEAEIGNQRTEKHSLKENWRSAETLVKFNNDLFSIAAARVSQATGQPLAGDAYHDIGQLPARHQGKGFVRIEFIDNWSGKEDDTGEQQALQQVPLILEQMQSLGIALHDIAILVRKNEEGQRIATSLLQYKSSPMAKKGCSYDVVSNESLRLDAASAVLLLISALKFLNNPQDAVARGELVYEYFSRSGSATPQQVEERLSQSRDRDIRLLLPEEMVTELPWLVRLSLVELVETLIRIFRLGDDKRELAYLQSFQDLVMEFATQEKSDISSFLEWWEQVKEKKSIKVAASVDAAGIYTIHGAKGLQFKYVIVPFCSWMMNHEIPPLLWCKTDHAPFNKLGTVAVRYTSKLEKTFFADDYDREFTRVYLDNLNLLYVALTRAEAGMIILAPKPIPTREPSTKIRTAGQLLFDSIQQSETLQGYYEPNAGVFSMGKEEALHDPRQEDSFIPVQLDFYPSFDWRKKLVIKREGTEFFMEEKTSQRKQINYGILLHRALSGIRYRQDADEVLKKLNFEGVIMEDEVVALREQIGKMMDHPVAGNWFSKEWHVQTEAPVIIPGGKAGRLDRVIFKEVQQKGQLRRKAVIIDYKSGARKTEDRKQVEGYAQVLSQMGYVDVEGYLFYLDKLEPVLVVDKSNLSLPF